MGRLDVLLEVSLLSACNAAPREGHLDALYHIFGYLKLHARSYCIAVNPCLPNFDVQPFVSKGLEEFYEVEEEPLPKNAPEPRGQPMKMTCFVDASHSSNKVTYRSRTGIFIC